MQQDIYIYDEITPSDLSNLELINNLTESDTLIVHINSIGGDVNTAITLYNAIKTCKAKTESIIEGVAMSAASYISLACETRRAYDNTIFMLHLPSCCVDGNSVDMQKTSEMLDTYTSALKLAYIERAKISEEEVIQMLEKETFLTAQKAQEIGFINSIEGEFDRESVSVKNAHALMQVIMKANLNFKTNQIQNPISNNLQIMTKEEIINKIKELISGLNDDLVNQFNEVIASIEALKIAEENVEEVNVEPEEEEVVSEPDKPQEEEKKPEENVEEAKAEETIDPKIEEMQKQIDELKKMLEDAKNRPMNIGSFMVTDKKELSIKDQYAAIEDSKQRYQFYKQHKYELMK